MATWMWVLLAVVIAPLIFRNADSTQKLRVRSALKVIITLWVLVTLFLIGRVGYQTHWINVPALILVACIPFAIIVGAFMWMSRTVLK